MTSLFLALDAVLFDRSRRRAGLAHRRNAARSFPMRSNLAYRRVEHRRGRALVIQLARNLGHTGERANIGCLIGHRRRRGSSRRCSHRSRGRRQRRRSRIPRSYSRRHIQTLQVLVALFLARKQFLNSLQPLDRLVPHPVLHQDFRLQHKILQRRSPQRRPFHVRRFGSLAGGAEARRDYFEASFVHLSLQHIQPLQVSGFIRIDFGGAVQTFGGLGILFRAAIQIKQFQQGLTIIIFAIGGVIQFAEKLQHRRAGPPCCRDVFHDGNELPAFSAAALELFQLARQRYRLVVLLAIQQTSNQRNHLLYPARILLKQLPHQRLGFGVTACRHQRVGIGFAQPHRHLPGVHLRFKNEDGRSRLPLQQQSLAVGQSDALIRSIFLVSAFVPLRRVAALGRGQLRHLLKRQRRGPAVAALRRQFGYALQVGPVRFQGHDAVQNLRSFLLFAEFHHIRQRRFVGADRELFIGAFQQLAKAEFLLPRRTAVPRQLLVSQAGASRVPGPHLALEQIAQQPDRVGIAAQRQAQIRGQLPHHVVLHIIPQHKEIFVKGFRSLAFLQKLLRALHALPYLGSVRSSCDLRHAESGGVNPPPILGAPPNSSNAVTTTGDYEGHAGRPRGEGYPTRPGLRFCRFSPVSGIGDPPIGWRNSFLRSTTSSR